MDLSIFSTFSLVIGKSLILTPVALKIALAMAGATATKPPSENPFAP
jgi:hypothetical protein